jgi:hypothetical protein
VQINVIAWLFRAGEEIIIAYFESTATVDESE